MAEYQLTATDTIIRTSDSAFIPNDPVNRDRADYEIWLAAGGVPDPYVPPPEPLIIARFTPPQIIAAFETWGVAAAVLNAIDKVTLAKFYTATTILETDPLLLGELQQIGKTMADLKAALGLPVPGQPYP